MTIEPTAEDLPHGQPLPREAWETPQLHRLPLGDAELDSNPTTDGEGHVS